MKSLKRLEENIKYIIRNPTLAYPLLKNYFLLASGKKPLRTVEMALTYKCQCNCKYCSAEAFSDDKKQKQLTLEEYKQAINQSIRLGAIHFLLTGGEPLLSKNLFDIIKYIKKRKRICTMATNGILLTKENTIKLKKAGLDLLEVSLDSMDKEKHNSFRKYKDCFEKTIQGIKNSKKAGIKTLLNFIVTKNNIQGLPKLLKLSKNLNVNINLGFACLVGKWKNNKKQLLSIEDWKRIDKIIKYSRIRWCGDTCYLKKGCSAGLERIYITAYGDITPCPLVPIKFGNIRNIGIKKILKNIRKNKLFSKINKRCLPASVPELLK